jgi:hypothetical protein
MQNATVFGRMLWFEFRRDDLVHLSLADFLTPGKGKGWAKTPTAQGRLALLESLAHVELLLQAEINPAYRGCLSAITLNLRRFPQVTRSFSDLYLAVELHDMFCNVSEDLHSCGTSLFFPSLARDTPAAVCALIDCHAKVFWRRAAPGWRGV